MPTFRDIRRYQQRTHAERLAARHACRARDIAGHWNGAWSARQWERLLAEWNYTCAYCGRRLPADDLTPDHRTPLVRGGKNALWNLLPACARCNSQKGARTEAEYRAYLATKEAGKPMSTTTPLRWSTTKPSSAKCATPSERLGPRTAIVASKTCGGPLETKQAASACHGESPLG